MMQRRRQSDRSVIGDEQSAVKRQLPHDKSRREAVTVQEPVSVYHESRQSGDPQDDFGQPDHKIPVLGRPADLHRVVHPVPDVKQCVRRVELDTHRCLAALRILRILQDDVGNGAVVPGIVLLVENIPVHFRVPAHRAHICRHDDLHERDLLPFPAFAHNIPGHFFIVELRLQEHLRIAAHGHQIRGDPDDRIHFFESSPVRPVSEHAFRLLLLSSQPDQQIRAGVRTDPQPSPGLPAGPAAALQTAHGNPRPSSAALPLPPPAPSVRRSVRPGARWLPSPP